MSNRNLENNLRKVDGKLRRYSAYDRLLTIAFYAAALGGGIGGTASVAIATTDAAENTVQSLPSPVASQGQKISLALVGGGMGGMLIMLPFAAVADNRKARLQHQRYRLTVTYCRDYLTSRRNRKPFV